MHTCSRYSVGTVNGVRAAMGRTSIPFEIRFWAKVDKRTQQECWNWTGAKNVGGYGTLIEHGSKMIPAHRASYQMAFGAIEEGLVVRHKCDNRTCVNPHHLELGTPADNRRDSAERGTAGGAQRKLTDEQVREIRASNGPCREVGARYGVSGALVSKIRNGLDRKYTV